MTHTGLKDKPQRSCLGCRKSCDRDLLLRYVVSPEGEIVADLESRLPGRGAYTCMSSVCLVNALTRRQFSRAFKRDVVQPAPEIMVRLVVDSIRSRILGYLGLANKAGKIISGSSLVSDAVRSAKKPGLILIASDVSKDIGEKIEVLASVHHVPWRSVLTKDEFGDILGKAPRSAVAVRDGGFSAKLIFEIERYRNFLGEVQH